MKTLTIVLLLTLSSFANSENLTIPKQINDYIIKEGCAEVSDFYATHETVRGAPFIYDLNHKTVNDYYSKSKQIDTSFAVWCQRKVKDSPVYYLKLNVQSKLNPFSFCPSEIMHKADIGKLSIAEINNVPLSRFYDAQSGSFDGTQKKVSGYVIESSYDGAGFQFYCESNSSKWKVLPID